MPDVFHHTLVDNELHEAFHRVASSDPGAIGAGKYWLDTSATPHVLNRRNAGNTAWVTVGASGGSGSRGGWDYLFINDAGTYRAYNRTAGTTTSDTTLTTLFNSLRAANLHFHFATGTFTATGNLDLMSGMRITGEGFSTIFNRTTSGGIFRMIGATGSANHIVDVVLSDVRVTGPSTSGTQVGGSGIYLQYASRCTVENCWVSGFGSLSDEGGIELQDEGAGCILRHNICSNNKNGICLGSPGSATLEVQDCRIEGNHCYQNYDDGIHSQRCSRIVYLGNTCWGHPNGGAADGAGIDVLGDEGDVIVANICYGNGRGIEVGNTASTGTTPDRGHVFVGNSSYGNTNYGYTIIGHCQDVVFVGNTARGNGADGFRVGTTNSVTPIDDVSLNANSICDNGARGIDMFGYVNRFVASQNRMNGNTTCDIGFRVSTGTPSAYIAFDNHLGSTTKIQDTAAQTAPTRDSNGNITF